MKIQALIVTMFQKDFFKIKEMNIQSDVIFANQDDKTCYDEVRFGHFVAKMITTDTRGVGINRNIGLMYSDSDILLLGDDDMVYNNGYSYDIEEAFKKLPDADVIVFGCDFTKNGIKVDEVRYKTKKCHKFNSMKFGTSRIAIRRKSLVQSNIYFSVLFGGGAKYNAGEDSLFLIDCFNKGLKVYSHEYILGSNAKDTSSWFKGYDEKYFYDKGAWIAAAFKFRTIIKYYFAIRFRGMTRLSLKGRLQYLNFGIQGYKQLLSYNEWLGSKYGKK